jgi:predicted ribosomally synthesized peptide with SipW-like signal peptide
MKKILFSILTIASVTGVVATGATTAFFSDTETSEGNTFAAGSIDLQITSQHYSTVPDDTFTDMAPGNEEDGYYFNFSDVKPGDMGSTSMSYTPGTNDAWVCSYVEVTEDDDVDCTDPEETDDTSCEPGTAFSGEMEETLEMFWWDDANGDMRYDAGTEDYFYSPTPVTLSTLLDSDHTKDLTFADSTMNAYTGIVGDTIEANSQNHLAIAWCFGEMTLDSNADYGFTCNGEDVSNAPQTDRLTGTLAFRAIQARNNLEFECPEQSGEDFFSD